MPNSGESFSNNNFETLGMATIFFFFLRCLQQNYKTKVSNNTWTFLEEQIFEIPPAK